MAGRTGPSLACPGIELPPAASGLGRDGEAAEPETAVDEVKVVSVRRSPSSVAELAVSADPTSDLMSRSCRQASPATNYCCLQAGENPDGTVSGPLAAAWSASDLDSGAVVSEAAGYMEQ